MKRPAIRFLAMSTLFLFLMPALAACGGGTGSTGTSTTPAIRVGLVTDIGGLNDKGFNHLAYLGLQKAHTDLGVQVDVTESHTGDDYVPNLTKYASKGYDLVIAVGFLMQTAVGTVSGQFPKVHFAIIDGLGTDANFNDLKHTNVAGLLFKEQDAGALVGVITGMLEKQNATPKKSHKIGAVGGISIPPVNHYIAGYKWGATKEDPTTQVLVGYSNDFTDPAKCAGVANSQIGNGADVIFQVAGGCGLGALQAAGKKGVYSIGVDTDQKDADASVIASALKRVDVATYTAIKSVKDGTFSGGVLTFSLQNDGVGYAAGNLPLPADIVTEVQNVSAQIKSGAITVPDSL